MAVGQGKGKLLGLTYKVVSWFAKALGFGVKQIGKPADALSGLNIPKKTLFDDKVRKEVGAETFKGTFTRDEAAGLIDQTRGVEGGDMVKPTNEVLDEATNQGLFTSED